MAVSPELDQTVLNSNLQALAEQDRALVERLCWPVGNDHVGTDADGSTIIYHRRSPVRLHIGRQDATLLVEGAVRPDCESSLLVEFGIGDGELIDAALESPRVSRVVAWDRDPWLMRAFLASSNREDAIRRGRLRLLMGPDIVNAPRGRAEVVHPALANRYVAELRIPASEHLPTALLLDGELFVDDIRDALWDSGYKVYCLDSAHIAEAEMDYTVRTLRPQVIFAVNYRPGLAEFAERNGVDLCVWEIDPAVDPAQAHETQSSRTHLFTYRDAQTELLRCSGFENAHYLPLAANPDRRRPIEVTGDRLDRYRAPVSFVGASMVDTAEHYRRLITAFIESHWTSPRAAAMRRSVLKVLGDQRRQPDEYIIPHRIRALAPELEQEWSSSHPETKLDTLLGEIAASERRLSVLAHLAPYGVTVWGDIGFAALRDLGIVYMGPAGHGDELTMIYSNTRINIDISRAYQADIVTMRVFDVLACGGFLLTERNDALAELFDVGRELETYGSLQELTDKVSYFLQNPQQASEIAERGRARVHRDHTIRNRVETMLHAVRHG